MTWTSYALWLSICCIGGEHITMLLSPLQLNMHYLDWMQQVLLCICLAGVTTTQQQKMIFYFWNFNVISWGLVIPTEPKRAMGNGLVLILVMTLCADWAASHYLKLWQSSSLTPYGVLGVQSTISQLWLVGWSAISVDQVSWHDMASLGHNELNSIDQCIRPVHQHWPMQ